MSQLKTSFLIIYFTFRRLSHEDACIDTDACFTVTAFMFGRGVLIGTDFQAILKFQKTNVQSRTLHFVKPFHAHQHQLHKTFHRYSPPSTRFRAFSYPVITSIMFIFSLNKLRHGSQTSPRISWVIMIGVAGKFPEMKAEAFFQHLHIPSLS